MFQGRSRATTLIHSTHIPTCIPNLIQITTLICNTHIHSTPIHPTPHIHLGDLDRRGYKRMLVSREWYKKLVRA